MAAPTYQDKGTFQSGGAVQLTVPWPTHAVDDIALLIYNTAGVDPDLVTAAGFAEIPDSPQSFAGLGAAVYWCRATSTSMASPVTGTGVNNCSAVIVTLRGCLATGDPWDVTSGSQKATGSTATSITGDTTTVDDCLIVYVSSRSNDAAANQFSGEADATLTGLAERVDDGVITGNGGGLGLWTGTKATAGAYGPLTATIAGLAAEGYFSIALKPDTPPQALTGTLYTSAPSFFTGVVTLGGDQALSGVLYASVATFFTGALMSDQTVTGTLFQQPPTFPVGAVLRSIPANLLLNEIGVMGHSSVGTIVDWYRTLSARDLLTPVLNHGGYDAAAWGDPTNPSYAAAWAKLDDDQPVGGFRAYWVMLGFLENYTETQAQREAWADHIYTRLMTDFPTIGYIWWSPMTTYFSTDPPDGDAEDLVALDRWGANPTGLVEHAGTILDQAPRQSWELTAYTVAQGYADDYGPWINLLEAQTDPDGRHPSEAPGDPVPNGATHGGDVLLAFFEDAQGLSGTLHVNTPTFFTGTVTADAVTVSGTLYTNAPSFFAGDLTQVQILTGTLFTAAPTFNVGTLLITVSQRPSSTVSNVGWDTAPSAGQSIHVYVATDDSDYITVTV